jgi:two-component system, NarL family, nitrate/nitrite response regulator NarL
MPRKSAETTAVVRIVIADDHPIFRDGLKGLLESEPGFSVVGEAADGMEAVNTVQALQPEVLLLDVAMPRMGGLEALSALAGSPTRVIMLAASISDDAIVKAIQLGARGVVLKEAATRQLLEAIHRVVSGKYVVGADAVECLAEALRRSVAGQTDRPYNLTHRELEIISAIVTGQTNKDIADHLSISVQTVKHHLTSIFDKTGVSSRLELALFAVSRHVGGGED